MEHSAQARPVDSDGALRDVLVLTPATAADHRLAIGLLAVSTLVFLAALPVAKVQLAAVPAFTAGYQSALIFSDLITAALLLSQYRLLRLRALWPLATGYLFTACMALLHMLTFPGLFAPSGLLGGGPQTTAWMYMAWHAAFPALVIAYAVLRRTDAAPATGVGSTWAIVASPVVAVIGALAFTALATRTDLLPAIMNGNHYTPIMRFWVGSVWGLSLLALVVLWFNRPRTVLDLWLILVCGAWLFDIGLAAVFNQGRYDLGFYLVASTD